MTLDKATLRARLNTERAQHTSLTKRLAARDLAAALMAHPCWSTAHTILAYWPTDQELDVRLALGHAHAAGKRIALPVTYVEDRRLEAALFPATSYHTAPWGALEPEHTEHLMPKELDWVWVPALAFQPHGGWRLGMGGGYYDRYLATLPHHVHTTTITFAPTKDTPHAWPVDPWDQPTHDVCWVQALP